ncbi:MAG: hypothetical protein Q9M24_03175 [Mariprofundaceae bacterium]|nr:hypothetical protein [Mariprofundaceae bacterium]
MRNFVLASMLLFLPCQAWAVPVRVLMDVRSTHSDGAHDMNTLASMAEKRGVDVLVFGEHDRSSIRFGIAPISRILGYSMERPSLYTTGLTPFFADLARVRGAYPDMTFMAATESIPGYYWSGIPFRDLTLHNAERHIIALGIERPEQVEALPSYTLSHIHGPFKISMAFWWILIGSVLIMLLRRRKRAVALLLFAAFVAFLSTWLLKPKVDADADFIKTAQANGLFVIWAHPGTLSGVRSGPMGVKLDTPPYSRRVFHNPTAGGFAAVYGDTDTNTEPGGLWDQYMMNYMLGLYDAPIWGVAAGDFHKQGEAGEYLGNFPMDMWVDERDPAAILAAMRKGHMVAWGMPKDRNLRVKSLFLEDATGHRLLPGDEITASGQVVLHCSLEERPEKCGDTTLISAVTDKVKQCCGNKDCVPAFLQLLRAQIIVDGHVLIQPLLGLGQPLLETLQLPPGAHVIRLRIPAQHGIRMEANPFLVRVPG